MPSKELLLRESLAAPAEINVALQDIYESVAGSLFGGHVYEARRHLASRLATSAYMQESLSLNFDVQQQKEISYNPGCRH